MREGNGFFKASSPFVLKNRNSSGCLIVRKKGIDESGYRGDGVGISGHGKDLGFGERNKRHRIEFNESGSCDELSSPVSNTLNPDKRRIFNGFGSERKRTRGDGFDCNEYDMNGLKVSKRKQIDDSGMRGRRLSGSLIESAYEMGMKVAARSKGSLLNYWPDDVHQDERFRHPEELFRENDHVERIRVQGKNGVLKVMVNKKNSACNRGSVGIYDGKESSFHNNVRTTSDSFKEKSKYKCESKMAAKEKQFRESNDTKVSSLKSRTFKETSSKIRYENDEVKSFIRLPIQDKGHSVQATDSEESDTSMKMRQKRDACISEKVTSNQNHQDNSKHGNVKRGSGTEKQKLRGRIKQMLLDAGWSIDYRPRKNRDYLDAVYISPTGTAYWSIIKAYEAFRKKLNDDEPDTKSADDDPAFPPLPDELLNQLTRRTKKKMEKEIKKMKEHNAREDLSVSPAMQDDDSFDSDSKERKPKEFKASKRAVSLSVSPSGECDAQVKQLCTSNVLQKKRMRKLGRCALQARGLGEGLNSESDGFVPYVGKRTIISWLIESGVVQSSQKVLYMNRKRSKAMLEGWITLDGIHCGCCSKILSVSKFEVHAGSKLCLPYQNICLESGVSLMECQINAWNRLKTLHKIGFHWVDVDSGDPNDDTCCLCGDGGDLLCCDGCPSTFHQNCLQIKMVPSGDWRCPNCACKYCGNVLEKPLHGDKLLNSSRVTCSFCAKNCHVSCIPEKLDHLNDNYSPSSGYCGNECRELFKRLQRCLGVKHEVEEGFSWSLIHRSDSEADNEVLQRVECNSKLVVASLLLDECFLPTIDRRSGINIIQNVVYNCGSNFSRLNFNGFYTVILEKGDEMISVASLRFHGAYMAEMPFIGTRHTYRRQGMCHRLMNAIESLLKSLNIERMVIPAISHVKSTWMEAFGFEPISPSLKQELKSFNVLVFPGLDMLEKQLF